LRKIRARDGSIVTLDPAIISHIIRKHPDALLMLNSDEHRLPHEIERAIESPDEIFTDRHGSVMFLRKAGNLFLNVVVRDRLVRTAYLIGQRTHSKMRRNKWLQRLL